VKRIKRGQKRIEQFLSRQSNKRFYSWFILGPFFFHIPNFVVSFKAAEEKLPSEKLDVWASLLNMPNEIVGILRIHNLKFDIY
jgi:hypothetical protein